MKGSSAVWKPLDFVSQITGWANSFKILQLQALRSRGFRGQKLVLQVLGLEAHCSGLDSVHGSALWFSVSAILQLSSLGVRTHGPYGGSYSCSSQASASSLAAHQSPSSIRFRLSCPHTTISAGGVLGNR